MNRKNIQSGTPWESEVGYSRAVKAGNLIFVSGTTAVDEEGEISGVGDLYLQSVKTIEKIRSALAEAGATLNDVVRTRIFVRDISRWEEVGRAHAEYFGKIRPATSMVEVQKLIHPDMLVEIEAVAIVD